MQRQPEPELMNDADQAEAYFQADFNESNSLFCELLIEALLTQWSLSLAELVKKPLKILDLGCGDAEIPVRIAQQLPLVQIDAVDGAAAMLHFAEQRLQTAQLTERIHLIQAHLPSTQLQTGYDVILSNSLLHHLHYPQILWRESRRLAHPQTVLLVMDLMRPESRHQAEIMMGIYAKDAPPVLRRDFFNSLLAAYRLEEIQQQLHDEGLSHLTAREVSDRHWAVAGKVFGS